MTPIHVRMMAAYGAWMNGRMLPRWVLVTHMFNHGTHHGGQLTTLIKQLGIEPGVTDLPWLPALYDGKVLRATQM